jgi:hypothetical protein
MIQENDMTRNDTPASLSRRALLRRIGLAAGAIYVAPAMVGLNAAHASGNSGGGNSGASGGRSSGASGNSGVSRASRASRGSGRRGGRGSSDTPAWVRQMLNRL